MTENVPTLPLSFLENPIAHRGYHDPMARRPENSRSSVASSVLHKYVLEVDVQLSSDGVAIAFHDSDLSRTVRGGEGLVRDFTADELSKMRLKRGRDKVARLDDILRVVAGRVPVLIEIKDQTGSLEAGDGAIEGAVARAIEKYKGEDAIMSENPEYLVKIGEYAPDVARGLVTGHFNADAFPELPAERLESLQKIADFERVGASFIAHTWKDLENPRVAELMEQGAAILGWTVRNYRDDRLARKIADNVIFELYEAEPPAPAPEPDAEAASEDGSDGGEDQQADTQPA